MRVLIVEDEVLAADRISRLIRQCEPEAEVIEQFDTVEETVRFFRSGNQTDLLVLDVQLADGKSFEIFDKVDVHAPVIFTTAFDQYALEAFQFLSIDYLLKPVQEDTLRNALQKLKRLGAGGTTHQELRAIKSLIMSGRRSYRERMLIKNGNKLLFKTIDEVAYFFADGKAAYLVGRGDGRKFLIDHTLEQLEGNLDPERFFRISRKFIVHISSIAEVRGLISGKLEIKLSQPCEHALVVSKERAAQFKAWLGR